MSSTVPKIEVLAVESANKFAEMSILLTRSEQPWTGEQDVVGYCVQGHIIYEIINPTSEPAEKLGECAAKILKMTDRINQINSGMKKMSRNAKDEGSTIVKPPLQRQAPGGDQSSETWAEI